MTGAPAMSAGGAGRRRRRRTSAPWWLGAAAVLAGCAVPDTLAPPAAIPAPPARVPGISAPVPDEVLAFEQQRRRQALLAEREGRLADAAWDWEVLTVLRPADLEAAQQLGRLRRAIDERVAALMARAGEDRRRGDSERAMQGYLGALALSPRHAPAAQALRAIERERNERGFAGRFARAPQLRAPPVTMALPSNGARLPAERNLVEHATMLAAQGELDGAIQLLAPAAEARSADPSLVRLLADLHFRRAQAWLPARPTQALASLRECLRLDPSHAAARTQWQTLLGGVAPR